MRMWMVNPEWMCRQHLTGEHGEIHKFRHNFVKGHSYAKRVAWNQIEPSAMERRHDELAAFLGNHKSPYEQPDAYGDGWGVRVDRDASLMLLLTKCPACRAKFRSSQ